MSVTRALRTTIGFSTVRTSGTAKPTMTTKAAKTA